MPSREKRLSGLPGIQEGTLRLDRNLLKDRAAEVLRDYIGSGRIPEGTKLTEREVSRLLGISRMPAHEALTILEAEGLVVSRPDGRYVIELSEKDVRDIHALRCTLERLAVQLAAANASPKNHAALSARLQALEEAVASGNPEACTKCDMALHRVIWQQTENPHLLRVLDSVLGAIFVLADRVKLYGCEDFGRMLNGHRELVERVAAGDGDGAAQLLESHLKSSLAESLRTFQVPRQSGAENAREQV
jgi:DNA-binding GntR family transcriptional regulator